MKQKRNDKLAREKDWHGKKTGGVFLTLEEARALIVFLSELNDDIVNTHKSNFAFQYINKRDGRNMPMNDVLTIGERLSWKVNFPVNLILEKVVSALLTETPKFRDVLREITDPVFFERPNEANGSRNTV